MIAGDDHDRYVRVGQSDKLFQRETEGSVRWPDRVEEVSAVEDRIRPKFDDPIDEGLEGKIGVNFSLVQSLERTVIVTHLAVGGISEVCVRHMNDPQLNSSFSIDKTG